MFAALIRNSGLLRAAHLIRLGWYRVRRPVTLGTRAILADDQGAVLLIRHSYVSGWHLPGGGVDRGETLAAAIRREVREETGLEIREIDRMLGLYARFRHGASDHVAIFEVRRWAGEIAVDGLEIVDARFFDPDMLPAETTPATRRRIAEWRGRTPIADHW